MFPAPATAAEPEDTRRPLVVTVDDLPVAGGGQEDAAYRLRVTEALLGHLRRHRIRAVGFVIWSNVRDPTGREILERWLAEGHELGNHSFSHPNYSATEAEAYRDDVERARTEIQALLDPLGRKVRFFRFPYLREGDTAEKVAAMRAYLKESGQHSAPVTIDDQDWSYDPPWREARDRGDEAAMAAIALDYHAALRFSVRHHEAQGDEALGRTSPQILLLHANAIGAAEWGPLFDWLEETGHRFAGIDEVMKEPAISDPPAVVATHGYGVWDRMTQRDGEEKAREETAALLARQVEAWNRGDLEAFCSVYADDATYVSPSGLVSGRTAILRRYTERYPDRAAMGTLALEVMESRVLDGVEVSVFGDAVPGRVHAVSVVGRWRIERPGREPAEGRTLVIFRRRGTTWSLVQDASF